MKMHAGKKFSLTPGNGMVEGAKPGIVRIFNRQIVVAWDGGIAVKDIGDAKDVTALGKDPIAFMPEKASKQDLLALGFTLKEGRAL